MSSKGLKSLKGALDFHLSEVLRLDLWTGVGGAVAAGVAVARWPGPVISTAPWAAGIVGAILGAVVTGLSVQVAFLDQPFLRKLTAIGRDPVRYLSPFLFTAVLAIVSLLPLVVLANLTATTATALLAPVGVVAGFMTFWTVASVLPALDTLVQFVRLKIDALDVPDDVERTRFDRNSSRRQG